tara:strand:- start:1940 stop:3436 length:1497 start_codon:yes stop_codon:yes gene_type:complete
MVKPKVILEMANNHMGDVGLGVAMINSFSRTIPPFLDTFEFVWKFQFRDLDTFIHPDYKDRMDVKYVKRFSETNLTKHEFESLKDHAQYKGFNTLCTAFDENSVTVLEDMGFDMIKVASCSCTDWPLLNRIVENRLPIIISVAGASLENIDNVVSFLKHRNKDFSLMHCVGEYPTKLENLQLNQIDLLKSRYPDIPVGYSTHEHPTEVQAVQIAVSKGATILEKHVAVETEEHKKNAYSVNPDEFNNWLVNAQRALTMCGQRQGKPPASDNELADLGQFKRGVFVNRDIKEGETITRGDVFYAWPNIEGQVLANDMSKYTSYTATQDIPLNKPLMDNNSLTVDTRSKVWDAVQAVKKFITESTVVFPGEADLELSHHYGIDKFFETGITMITVVNRAYCKKLIIVLPGQTHPAQYHKKKEETFVVLHGQVKLTKDDWVRTLERGHIDTIEPGTVHSFTSDTGCIIEEVSSTHYVDDSYYIDPAIHENKDRKTFVTHWL